MDTRASSHILRVVLVLGFVLAALPPSQVRAQQPVSPKAGMTASLQDAFLAATSRPFSADAQGYVSEHNGLSYTVSQGGLRAKAGAINWSVTLKGMGRGNSVHDVASPTIVQTTDRVEYQRGDLTEWYRNLATGVEQGFTINASPRGSGKLVLHLDLTSSAAGTLSKDSRGLSFASRDGRTLRYDQLKAYDANGRELEAKFLYTPAQTVIQVNDESAAYPIVIDPFIYLEQKVIAVHKIAGAAFGQAVALLGDTALVGAPGDDDYRGSAYVFIKNGGVWTYTAKLTASDAVLGDALGSAVALSGDTALVGAYQADTGRGSAYVFVKPGGGWEPATETAKLTASDGSSYDGFGFSAALDGSTALLGAYGDNGNTGSAYVFVKPGGGWTTGTETAKLTASDGAASDVFGISVALSGDFALVGALGDDTSRGSAYMFVKPGGGWVTGTQTAKLTASDGAALDYFGTSVALSGDSAVMGAYGDDGNTGSAYVFVKPGGGWVTGTQTAKLTPSDGAVNDNFGSSTALSGDNVVIGAPRHDGYKGAAYVFAKPVTGWASGTETTELTASDRASGDWFGTAVALDGDTALVGDSHEDGYAGSAYFYYPNTDLGVSAAFSAPGSTVFVSTSVANFGPTYSGLTLAVNAPLPTGLTYAAHSATLGSYDSGTGLWEIGSFPSGSSANLTIEATVIFAPPQNMTFTASLVGDDSNSANNSASDTLTLPRYEWLATFGSFDYYTGASKIPDGWTASKFSPSDGKNTATKQAGTASVKITGQAGKTKTLTYNAPGVDGFAGDVVTLTFYEKSVAVPAAGKCMGTLTLLSGATKVIGKSVNCSNGSTNFKLKTLSVTAPSAFDTMQVKFTYSKSSGSVYFDSASLLR